ALTERVAFGRSTTGERLGEPREDDRLALHVRELVGLPVGPWQREIRGLIARLQFDLGGRLILCARHRRCQARKGGCCRHWKPWSHAGSLFDARRRGFAAVPSGASLGLASLRGRFAGRSIPLAMIGRYDSTMATRLLGVTAALALIVPLLAVPRDSAGPR